jgi:hypothetical protein
MLPSLSQIPDGAFFERNEPFRMGSAPISLNWREYRRSGCTLRQPALAFAEIAKA